MDKRLRTYARDFFADKHGNIVVWQMPNPPLLGWIVSSIIATFTHGAIESGLHKLASAFIFTWAYLEITSGSSPFRRVLGAIVAALTIIGLFS